ncbi:hypothetical protein DYB37_001931 [Aphanomyces astaci]|uniref:GOLD domain-containing protein n=1 Tax=Aphanomyces astaci TaxID=112090 RepID=A0A397DUH1_APHAT|nr:hypothetical protein AaE_011058 [Aphanomyces astaci]RHX98301.1 hypothetical protein DYB25_004130 [Aphanomyces astaci]RHY09914.1 hypothetical protein DYB36_000081 [Aphanomyces astaci]RHY60348.1 hypothetical protein DYB34_003385 [Aphanomyces astaci]RHY65536.1 hypothetical protein DYB30_002104 [Aphanomyces astaci]
MSIRAAILLGILVFVMGLNTDIPSGHPECFFLESQKYKEGMSLNYEVLRGMGDELVTTLSSPSGITLFHKTGPSGRFVSPVPEDGMYRVCFAQSTLVNIRVGFSFHADDPAHDVVSNADATKIEQARAVEDMVYELNTNLDTVKDTQSYMKAKSVYHHSVVDSTNSRIVLWSCIEATILVSLVFWQMSYLRRTFEVRRVF